MSTHADKVENKKSQSIIASVQQRQSAGKPTFQFVDNRPESVAQRRLQAAANNSEQVMQLSALQKMANCSLQAKLLLTNSSTPQEREADRIAEEIVATPKSDVLPHARPFIQHTANPSVVSESVPATVNQVLAKKGSPMAPEIHAEMSGKFGHDFSQIRIHTGSDAAKSAKDIRAKAFNVGTDIVFGTGYYAPDTRDGKQLLAHELTHVVQQSGKARVPESSNSARYVARSVDDWLSESRNIRAMTYTQLLAEIDELTEYLNRQISSSSETVRVEEVLPLLRAEVNRRDTAAAGPRARRRGRRRNRRRQSTTGDESLPTRYPRVLIEMSSVSYIDPAEMRAEYDLIMEWLERSDISSSERNILTAERDNLAPQLRINRERLAAERRTARLTSALTPPAESEAERLEALARTIQNISREPGNDSIFYIYHQNERVAISAEQAAQLRANLMRELYRGGRGIRLRANYYWERYNSQLAINRESPLIAGISGWLDDVKDPGDALKTRYVWLSPRMRTYESLLQQGRAAEAAAILPRIEVVGQEIRQLARTFYEGHIEGAEIAVSRLEFTRDASSAIAGSIAAVVFAPVVAGAVGGLGLTGASATVATIGGTGTVVGAGTAVVRGGSAAGGTLLAGGTLEEIGSAFSAEAWRGFREGFLSGAGGAAARSVGLALNAAGLSLTKELATRTGAEMLINGTTTMIDILAQGGSIEEAARAAAIAAAQAVPGALLGGSNNPVVQNLIAPFTSASTAYLAARANGASRENALAQAGVALASNVAMTRANHHSDEALVERGGSIGARIRETATDARRRVAAYSAAAMIGVADALPATRSSFGGTAVTSEADAAPRSRAVRSQVESAESSVVSARGAAATEAETAISASATPSEVETAAPRISTIDDEVANIAPTPAAIANTESLGAALTSELGLEAPGTSMPSGTRATRINNAHADALAAGWVDAYGDPIPGGPVNAVVGEHRDATYRRRATGQTGATRESAHIGATSILRTLAGYSRRLATTTLLPPATHRAFDNHWKRWIFNRRKAIRASGGTNFTATLDELLTAQRQALRQTPNLSPETRGTLESMLEREFYDLANTLPNGMNTSVPLPRIWGS